MTDLQTPSVELNPELGQVLTPDSLVDRMIDLSIAAHGTKVSVAIEPAVGPATFLRGLLRRHALAPAARIHGFDVDPRMTAISRTFMEQNQLKGHIYTEDYLLCHLKSLAPDLVIMNPPYIRNEQIADKRKRAYAAVLRKLLGISVSRRSNLYVYFLLKAVADLPPGGILCAVVYDGLTNTLYGRDAMHILDQFTETVHIESVKTPFQGVLVDATVLVTQRRKSAKVQVPSATERPPEGVTSLKNLLTARRGTGLVNAKVFMADQAEPYFQHSSAFVKKDSRPPGLVIGPSPKERAYLFERGDDVPQDIADWLRQKAECIANGEKQGQGLMSLFRRLERNPHGWFSHAKVQGPLLFNYYLRNQPRHLFNPYLIPAADNFYVGEATDIPNEAAWILLNSTPYQRGLVENARSQGSGLVKLQLFEYKEAHVPDWRTFDASFIARIASRGRELTQGRGDLQSVTAWLEEELQRRYGIQLVVPQYIETNSRRYHIGDR